MRHSFLTSASHYTISLNTYRSTQCHHVHIPVSTVTLGDKRLLCAMDPVMEGTGSPCPRRNHGRGW